MRRFGKALGRLIVVIFLLIAGIWAFAPEEPVDREISFEANDLPVDIPAWLAQRELQFSDIRPEATKRIVWAGVAGQKTPLAVIYVHGFSASAEEIRPVPDEVAKALGANLFYTRLAGHGRSGDAMAEPRAGDWIEDMAEAMAIGRSLGDRVVVIATSTGGTLAAIAATDPVLSEAETLSWLLLGRAPDGLGRNDTALLQRAGHVGEPAGVEVCRDAPCQAACAAAPAQVAQPLQPRRHQAALHGAYAQIGRAHV